MTKTYQYQLPTNLSTSIYGEGGKCYMVDFTGYTNGRGINPQKAEFTTDNQELQKVIESDRRFGSQFTLVESGPMPNDQDDNTAKDGVPSPEVVHEISDVRSTQMAIEWLIANRDAKFSKSRPSKAEVMQVAQSMDVDFVNWV